ncbi:histidine phosphatase family protein [Lactobacillus helveticus]|uniref:Phosphoserine phosphatase 2 n=1 Tax=Lactobacillus helveticus TaxID=1587 RepID=A0A9Q5CB19_LACHE|nr:histidine phosphatase family protein [Lactobacillus helveticus]NRO35514.1 putative phosphoserine phosphatase 2 [Lactobacillus helveticus]
MTKTLYLVRHGQTYFNYYHKVQGRCDSPLNEMGIRQVEMARDYFQKHDVHFDKAFSSTQERACDTLEIITDHKMPYKRLKDLREQCYGIFEGRDEFLLPWNYNNPNVDPTMEKDEDVVGRMHRAIKQILKGVNDGETALVVGHGDILAKYVRDVANPNFAGFANASIVKLSVDGKNVHLDTYVWPAESLKQI